MSQEYNDANYPESTGNVIPPGNGVLLTQGPYNNSLVLVATGNVIPPGNGVLLI